MKKFLIFFLFLALILPAFSAAATNSTSRAFSLSSHCPSIRNQLKSIQVLDSHTRIFLGSSYNKLSEHFITPFNLRLVYNNQPNSQLFNLQTEFVTNRQKFNQSFTEYSQDLESLLSTSCESEPNQFLIKLDQTKKSRENLSSLVTTLKNQAKKHRQLVEEILKKYE